MTVAQSLVGTHFTAQPDTPSELSPVDIAQLDPFLRGVLFTDGTVSRALEAHTLCEVVVNTVEQTPGPVPAPVAQQLELQPTDHCLRRRIVMTIGQLQPSVWAESYLAMQRMPQQFIAQLDGNPQGIGGSLQQLKLESRRELLWFGIGPLPAWAKHTDAASPGALALTRSYRVLTHGLPALLICESFALALHSGVYHLTGSSTSPPA
jgi:chorismate-pyruvate lyase